MTGYYRGRHASQPHRLQPHHELQLPRAHIRDIIDYYHHLRERAGVSERLHGESAENHYQLLHSQFGCCGLVVGGSGLTAVRVYRGESRHFVS